MLICVEIDNMIGLPVLGYGKWDAFWACEMIQMFSQDCKGISQSLRSFSLGMVRVRKWLFDQLEFRLIHVERSC